MLDGRKILLLRPGRQPSSSFDAKLHGSGIEVIENENLFICSAWWKISDRKKRISIALLLYRRLSFSLLHTSLQFITKTHKTCRKIIVLLFFVCFWGNWRGLLCTIVFAFHSITRYYWECGCLCVCAVSVIGDRCLYWFELYRSRLIIISVPIVSASFGSGEIWWVVVVEVVMMSWVLLGVRLLQSSCVRCVDGVTSYFSNVRSLHLWRQQIWRLFPVSMFVKRARSGWS